MQTTQARRWPMLLLAGAGAAVFLAVAFHSLPRAGVAVRADAGVAAASAHVGVDETVVDRPTSTDATSVVEASTAIDDLATLQARLATSSLRGAEPDGTVVFDASGAPIADADLRRLFEWYLSLIGEFTLPQIRTLLAHDLATRHGDTASHRVLALFDRYIGLRDATSRLDANLDQHAHFEALVALRRTWFGADADVMFGAEEAALSLTLDRLALRTDPTLDADERAALDAALDAALPADERTARADATIAADIDAATRAYDTAGTDAATRHADRSTRYGEDAATRLAALDAERAAWQHRIDTYQRARAALAADTTLDAATRATRLAALRDHSFAEHERRRIEALDAIGALGGG